MQLRSERIKIKENCTKIYSANHDNIIKSFHDINSCKTNIKIQIFTHIKFKLKKNSQIEKYGN